MKHLITESKVNEIDSICSEYEIQNYSINSDGSIDVDGNVDISYQNFKQIPIEFNVVHGDFICIESGLETLKNSPKIVHGDFIVSMNNLTTLEYLPRFIDGDFLCDVNDYLESLYIGDYSVKIQGDIDFTGSALPYSILDVITKDGDEEDYDDDHYIHDSAEIIFDSDIIRTIFKYQYHYNIWNSNGSFNKEDFNELIEEIKDGLL